MDVLNTDSLLLDRYDGLAEAMLTTIQLPLLVLDQDLRVIRTNQAFLHHFGTDDQESLGRPLYGLGNGQWDIPQLRRLLDEVIRVGQMEDYRVEHEFPNLGRRIMLLNARRIARDRSTRPDLILLSILDVTETEKLRFELEGYREYAEKLIDSLREAVVVLGSDLRVEYANATFYDIFNVTAEETEGRLIYELGNRQWDIPALRRLLEDILPNESTFDDYDVTHEFQTIGHRHFLLNARRLDHMDLILLAIEDVTERDASYRRQRVLAREMSHRVKNILTLVNSIAARTARSSASLDAFQEVFYRRLSALARSHGQWLADDEHVADLRELLKEALDTSGIDPERVDLDGPAIVVGPDQTLALNLTIHELATNAAKYGSLSVDAGRVELSWSVEDGGQVRLLWNEIGGPIVRPPNQRGFGVELIETLCPFELNGSADVRFSPDGLECELIFGLQSSGAKQ
jgi:PAS domain S-box-containing protein